MQHTGVAGGYQLGVPHLQLGELIGGGGFARVFHGYDSLLRRHLAVKILRPVQGVELRDMFEAEAAAHGALSRHPNIVTIHQVGWTVDGSRPFLVMDHVAGGSLADQLAQHGPVPWQHAVAWMIPVCSAVQHAHDLGILHRDIKPENILLEPPGAPLLSDFGIACLTDDTSPVPAMSIGHAAPEALRGERRGVASDVYSLGSTLYQLLTAGLPFGGDLFARIGKADVAPAPLPADRVPAWLDEAVRRAMDPDPARRMFSARELGRALEAGAGQATVFPPTVVARPVVPAVLDGFGVTDPRPPHPSVVPPALSTAPQPAGPAPTVPLAWASAVAAPGHPTPPATAPAAQPPTPAPALQQAQPQPQPQLVVVAAPPVAQPRPARSAGRMMAAAVLAAVLAVAATLVWAGSDLRNRASAGDGTAVAGPSATAPDVSAEPATVTEPATLGSEEGGDPGSSGSPVTDAAKAPEPTEAPTPTRAPTSGTALTPVTPTVTRTPDTTDPGVVTDPPPPAPITVPDVANRTVADASAVLVGAGLDVDPATTAATSCTIASGKVVKTNPAAGASATKGTKVKLTVSSGAPTGKVPATVGKTEQDAKTALGAAGFTTSVTAVFLPKGNADIGRVTAQSVSAGTTASTCTAVVLTVGRQQLSLTTPTVTISTVGGKAVGP